MSDFEKNEERSDLHIPTFLFDFVRFPGAQAVYRCLRASLVGVPGSYWRFPGHNRFRRSRFLRKALAPESRTSLRLKFHKSLWTQQLDPMLQNGQMQTFILSYILTVLELMMSQYKPPLTWVLVHLVICLISDYFPSLFPSLTSLPNLALSTCSASRLRSRLRDSERGSQWHLAFVRTCASRSGEANNS